MKFNKLIFTAVAGALFFASCSDDDVVAPNQYIPLGKYDSGVIVLNQGGFGHGDASMSYISANFETIENDIFSSANADVVLGDTAQDISFYGQLAYVILNGSNKIEIINRYTMKSVATMDSGFSNPRYMAIYNGKGYVTNWGDGTNPNDDYVAVINLATNTIATTIPVIEGPERIIETGGKLYVAQTGGYGYGNKISVINPANNAVATITVGDVPNSMQVKGGFLWVGCGGKPSFAPVETAGGISKINLSTNTVNTRTYADATKHVSNLVIDGAVGYFTIDAGIYKYDFASNLPLSPIFTTADQGVYGVYSFAVYRNHMYVGDAGDYMHNGHVYVYALGTGIDPQPIGTLEETYTVGVIPAGFYFNF